MQRIESTETGRPLFDHGGIFGRYKLGCRVRVPGAHQSMLTNEDEGNEATARVTRGLKADGCQASPVSRALMPATHSQERVPIGIETLLDRCS